MAHKEMNLRLKNRRDTLANWEAKNPVLLSGETAYVVLDSGVRQKTGDGTKTFKELPYDDADIYRAVGAVQASQTEASSQIAALSGRADVLDSRFTAISDIANNNAAAIANKADKTTALALQSEIEDLNKDVAAVQAEVDAVEKTVGGHTTAIASLQQTPPSHTHGTSAITGLDNTISTMNSNIADAASKAATALNTANSKAASDHSHTLSALGAAAAKHGHAIADVTNLATTISGLESNIASAASTANSALSTANGKANSNHTHTPASLGAAASSHGHAISDVTNLSSTISTMSGDISALETELATKANKADIATTVMQGTATQNNTYWKISDFGNWGTGTWMYKGFTMLITSRAGEAVWVSLAANDSATSAGAFRLVNRYTKIAAIYYSVSESAIYVLAAGWANNICAHILTNVNGDYVPTVAQATGLPSDAVSINIVEFGIDSTSTVVGSASSILKLGGSADRPTYNDKDLTLYSDLSSHAANTTTHVTAGERTNWNAAYSHSTAAHAPSGAEVNQNAFSNVKVGSVTIAADSKTDTLTIAAGSNIQLAGDATNDIVTISATDTTYGNATTSASGLMTAAMVTKLNGIATGANNYSLPTASSSTLGGVKTTSTVTSTSGYTACPIISGVPYYKDTNTTYALSSFGITASADELNYCDGVTSSIQTQLNAKAASSTVTSLSTRVGTAESQLTKVASDVAAALTIANDAYGLADSKQAAGSYAVVNAANTFDGEQKMLNKSYCPTMNDIASGVGCSLKNSRACDNQLIVAEVYAPTTAVTDSTINMTSTVGEIPFYHGVSGNSGQFSGKTLMGKITTSGWVGNVVGNVTGSATSLSGLTATVAELNYCDGVTSNIQTQLNGKLSDAVFYATYGTTTFAEIKAAHDAGKVVILDYSTGGSSAPHRSVLGYIDNNTASFLLIAHSRYSGSTNGLTTTDLTSWYVKVTSSGWSAAYRVIIDLNRTTRVNENDTNYTRLMARGASLNSTDTSPAVNGAIAWTYA